MIVALFVFSLAGALCVIAGAVRGFNWLMQVMCLDDDSWPLGPR